MSNESSKISKEEKYNTIQLDIHYESTKYCPICHMRLPIDKKSGCNSIICN